MMYDKDKDMREEILKYQKQYLNSTISRHIINVENLLQNGVGVPEHADLMETIELELAKIAEAHDKLEVIERYFE
mgnify:CR=1 FL=1|tara:strand:- start:1714 stop:1938 length:225 start_codon:yes stop_codon:yes gene_type:complete